MNGSLKPRPGIEGTTMSYAWPPSAGEWRAAKRGENERFVNGNEGRTSSGIAFLDGDFMWIK